MPESDFFAFCTSLQKLERKALGELSEVKHFDENELVYAAGDSGDELFIINRGSAEVTMESAGPGVMPLVLSRGDIFGEVGAFVRLPRNQNARACAPLSVRCFRAADFPELERRVPALFNFLCEKLAQRLFQMQELARTNDSTNELTGSLANFDVVTIYQTIMRAMQTGLLSIADENGETISEFGFENGVPRRGRFEHLNGEEAFWQLFIQSRGSWTFSFSQEGASQANWTEQHALNRNPEELLLTAIQMRDEFDEIRQRFADGSASVKRQKLNFAWPEDEMDELRLLGEEIWQIAYSQPISVSELCQRCSLCMLKIYRAVDEMVRAGLFSLQKNTKAPATMAQVEI